MKYFITTISLFLIFTMQSVAQFSFSSSKASLQSSIYTIDVGTPVGLKLVEPWGDNSISTDGIFVGFSHNSKIIGNNVFCLSVYGAVNLQFIDYSFEERTFEDFSFNFNNKSVEYAIGPGITYLLNNDIKMITYLKYGLHYYWNVEFNNYQFYRTWLYTTGLKINYKKLVTGIEYLPSFTINANAYYKTQVSLLRLSIGFKL